MKTFYLIKVNMNFIRQNKTIILMIGIIVAVYLMNKKTIHENLKNIYKKILNKYEDFNTCADGTSKSNAIDVNVGKKTTPTFYYEGQKDFGYHSENLKTSEAEQLYEFLQSMVTPDTNMYDLTSVSSKMYRTDEKSEELLINFIRQKFAKKVKNIKLLDKIHYFKSQVCLDIKPFQVEGDYIVDDKNYGKVKIQIELTFRFDQPNDIFMGNMTFNKYKGVFKISRVTLINHKTKKELESKEVKKNLPVQLDKPLTYSNYDTKFDFTYDTNLDTINSLIPEEIEVTEYEEDSVSQKVRL